MTWPRRLVIGLSIANLLMVEPWVLLNNPFVQNHQKWPAWIHMLGTLLDVLILGCALFLVERLLAKWAVSRSFRGFGMLLLTAAVLRSFAETLRYLGLPTIDWHPPHASKAVIAVAALVVLAMLYWLGRWRPLVNALCLLFFGLSIMLVFNVGDLAYAAIKEPVREYGDRRPAFATPPKPGPRVVWIIFDTLDYHYAFDERPSWLNLPELDRWRATTVQYDDARSPGPRTEISIPSLLTGRLYVNQEAPNPDDFDMTLQNGNHESLAAQRTIFADAEALGVRTALLGFHIPYGRIFGEQITYCRWWQWPNQFGSAEPWLDDAARQYVFLGSSTQQFENTAKRRIANHLSEMDETLRLVSDPSYRLLFVHLFPPHPGGMYDARAHRFSLDMAADPEEYEHSLGLVDLTLEEIRQSMERSGTWNDTLVIVSADHSWRSAIDLGKKVYLRIPFFAHFPSETSPSFVPGQTNTLSTHDLVLDYLRGKIPTPARMVAWVENWNRAHPDVPMVDDPRHLKDNERDRER